MLVSVVVDCHSFRILSQRTLEIFTRILVLLCPLKGCQFILVCYVFILLFFSQILSSCVCVCTHAHVCPSKFVYVGVDTCVPGVWKSGQPQPSVFRPLPLFC